ncbi:putative ribosomal protein S5 domain 2-type [Plasmopara halstedii]
MMEALLLDMDGVLAEVSQSYRQAIIDTAQHFGVQVTHETIDQLKLAGNANNDWQLTHRLILDGLSSTNASPTLEAVTAQFESLYQGTDSTKGLCKLETLLIPKGLLYELQRRLPKGMAVVTGRPRKDCVKFLSTHGIENLFPVRICMEDCPPKPSPEPVLLALKALNVDARRAVMIGDTVDDIIAGYKAGTEVYGVLTPQTYARSILEQKPSSMITALKTVGASVVLTPGLGELLDLIPPTQDNVEATSIAAVNGSNREASVSRNTKETSISIKLALDGTGKSKISSGIGFLDHMLTALAKHSRFDLQLDCKGDIWIDDHHTTEDCALLLGEAFDVALGGRAQIARFGSACVPLDEALARAIVDISSRAHSEINLHLVRPKIGKLSCEMITHFFESFASAARITLHIDVLRGQNDHHRAEASFKALAVALRNAVKYDNTAGIPNMADLVVEAGADGSFDLNAVDQAKTLREEGNEAFQRNEFQKAKDLYTRAIQLHDVDHLLYGNRSAACHQLKEFQEALDDAKKAIELSSDWIKGYLRKAKACEALHDYPNAIAAYEHVEKNASSSEAKKARDRLMILRRFLDGKNVLKKGFLADKGISSIYSEKEGLDQEMTRRSWKLMLKKLLDGCNKCGINSRGERVVLDDGVFAKLLQEDEFQRLIYPGIPKEQLVHAPKNLQQLLEDSWYEEELLALMPKVEAKAASVLTNVKKKGADQGDVMDLTTERLLMPQVLQEAFGREVLAMVHRVNYQKHVTFANDARLLADPTSDFATWDQLDEVFLKELFEAQSNVQGVAVMNDFMGMEWTTLLLNDVKRMAKSGLLLSTAPNIDAMHILSRQQTNIDGPIGAKLRFVEHQDCTKEYPALTELIEKLHALPYEINFKRAERAKLCAQFTHCTAIHQLPSGHRQPLRLDCGTGDKDNGYKLTCIYFFNQAGAKQKQTTLKLQTSLEENAPVRQIDALPDRLVMFWSQVVFNEISKVPEGEDLFYLTFWIHGQSLA